MSPASGGRVAVPVLAVVVVVLAVPVAIGVVGGLRARGADEAFLAVPETTDPVAGEAERTCDGRPREFMRFHHMDLLKEIRDEVLREGVGQEVSRGLERCRTCHEDRDRFCDRCHDAVDLSPDCFDCHYYP